MQPGKIWRQQNLSHVKVPLSKKGSFTYPVIKTHTPLKHALSGKFTFRKM